MAAAAAAVAGKPEEEEGAGSESVRSYSFSAQSHRLARMVGIPGGIFAARFVFHNEIDSLNTPTDISLKRLCIVGRKRKKTSRIHRLFIFLPIANVGVHCLSDKRSSVNFPDG